MHLDLIKKRRQKKVKSRLVHRLGDGLDVRDGLTHGYTQQIHVSLNTNTPVRIK